MLLGLCRSARPTGEIDVQLNLHEYALMLVLWISHLNRTVLSSSILVRVLH